MRIKKHKPNGKVRSYTIWLSANETYLWARKVRQSWPCSQLSGHRCTASIDLNGLYDYTVDGKITGLWGDELKAIVADHIPDDCKHLWPCWN